MMANLKNPHARILLSLVAVVGIGLLAYCGFAAVAGAADAPAKSKPSAADDEKAIRATADEFVKAFNAGDATTISAEWSTDSEYTDENGEEFHGRAAIEKEYAALFKEHPGATITVAIASIRFLGPDIAIEKGAASVKFPKGEPTAARYSVVHARRDGKWVMVVGRDMPYVAANGDYLKDLEWMIGEWKADGIRSGLQIKSEWLAGRNFIKNTYTTTADGKTMLTGAQIIGWNPRLGRIVGWHFDAEGGFGNDVWTKEGAKWVLEASGIFRDGSESSAVNIITPIDANSFNFQSVKRTLDHVSLPDLGPVKIVRVAAAK
jgi:uncharacterized protein (TIGR02246 family)